MIELVDSHPRTFQFVRVLVLIMVTVTMTVL